MKRLVWFIIFFAIDVQALIHTIGDSDTFFSFSPVVGLPVDFNEKIIDRPTYFSFKLHWLGASTLYQIEKHITKLLSKKFFVQSLSFQDVCIFSFGKVDCRCHIDKYVVESDPYSREKIVNDLVLRYQKALEVFKNKFTDLNLTIIILGIMPPFYKYHPNVSVVGTFEQRRESILLLNERLMALADKEGYLFLDQYALFADDNGAIPFHKTDTWTHIGTSFNYKVCDQLLRLISF